MDFQKSKTKDNLARAFAGECMDGAKYQFIIKNCKADYKYLSDLIRTIAKNEMAHAGIFYKLIVKYAKNCATNIDIKAGYMFEPYEFPKSLEASLEVERKESEKIYPLFADEARKEGFNEIAEAFDSVAKDETHHVIMLTQICNRLKNKELYKSNQKEFWLCSNCGHHEMANEAWKSCPSCSFPQGFVQFNLENSLKCTDKKTNENKSQLKKSASQANKKSSQTKKTSK